MEEEEKTTKGKPQNENHKGGLAFEPCVGRAGRVGRSAAAGGVFARQDALSAVVPMASTGASSVLNRKFTGGIWL
ncbi:hypothetical protein GCM10010198_67760 [Nocardia seriolae]|nr:hypothetical protein NSER024013_49480 [Nocardia seriolae]